MVSFKNSKGTPGTCVGSYFEVNADADPAETIDVVTERTHSFAARISIIVSTDAHVNFRKLVDGAIGWHTEKASDATWVHTLDYAAYNDARTEFIRDAIARGRVKSLDEKRKAHHIFEIGDILMYRTGALQNWNARVKITGKRVDPNSNTAFYNWERVVPIERTSSNSGKDTYFGPDYVRVIE